MKLREKVSAWWSWTVGCVIRGAVLKAQDMGLLDEYRVELKKVMTWLGELVGHTIRLNGGKLEFSAVVLDTE